jgi:hypothetical protein
MTDSQSSAAGGATILAVAALIALAIVLLVLFARGPEGEQRSGMPAQTAIAAIPARI